MSGSCKQESVADQEKLIRTSMTALKEQESEINALLYCLCSDGDARRRRALINIAMKGTILFNSQTVRLRTNPSYSRP